MDRDVLFFGLGILVGAILANAIWVILFAFAG